MTATDLGELEKMLFDAGIAEVCDIARREKQVRDFGVSSVRWSGRSRGSPGRVWRLSRCWHSDGGAECADEVRASQDGLSDRERRKDRRGEEGVVGGTVN